MENINGETKRLFHLMKEELRIPPYNYSRIKGRTLRELDFTKSEINWFLNKVEWKYGIELEEGEFSLDTPIDDFFQQIATGLIGQTSSYAGELFQTAI